MAALPFLKVHGIGNDFVALDLDEVKGDAASWARLLCSRKRGIGSDGLLLLSHPEPGLVHMEMLNPDGSQGGMCGNGVRCASLVALLKGWESGPHRVRIGERTTGVTPLPGEVFRVEMGQPDWSPEGAGVLHPVPWLGLPLPGLGVAGWAVGMGNPHYVVFDLEGSLPELGPQIEHHPLFSNRTNVQSARVESPSRIKVETWERGAGLTLACGSGACASYAAARRRGLVGASAEVVLPGGALLIEESPLGLAMTGSAALSYSGIWPFA